MYLSTTLQYTLQAIGESVLTLAANQEGQASADEDGAGMLGEPEPPCHRSVYFSPFPEREEKIGGADGARTRGLDTASVALSQLSYCPTRRQL